MFAAMIARLSSGTFRFILAMVCCCGCALAQPQSSHCKGPAELEEAIAAHPSAAAYDALGAYFAQQNQVAGAISAISSAVHLAPKPWGPRGGIGIAPIKCGDAEQPVRELRTAS